MELGDALILNGFIMLIGIVLITQLNVRTWFKKENFKIQKSNVLAQNKLQLRKLEKELGLTNVNKKGNSNINLNALKGIASELGLTGDLEEGEGDFVSNLLNGIKNFAMEHPEAVSNIMEKLNIGKANKEDDLLYSN